MTDISATANHPVKEPPVPYWRLSSFYFWYFALLGALYPYWALYFESLKFNPQQIGVLMAVMMGTKILAPNLWAWLADYTGRRIEVMRLGSCLSLLFFCGLFINSQFSWLVVVIVGYSFFWNAILPQHEAITLGFLHQQPEQYSQVRLWGSIGFVASVIAVGYLLDYYSTSSLPFVGALLCVAILISSLTIPRVNMQRSRRVPGGFLKPFKTLSVASFMVAGFLMQVAHGVYYSFFSIHLSALGYDQFWVGVIWGLGVIAEIVIFVFMHRLLPQFGVKALLFASLVLAAIRWYLIGHHADILALLVIAQTLHAFTFGTFHSASIEVIRQRFGRHHQGMGQAFYSAFSFGAGGAVGSLLAGKLWLEGADVAFNAALIVSAMGAVIILFGYRSSSSEKLSSKAAIEKATL